MLNTLRLKLYSRAMLLSLASTTKESTTVVLVTRGL